VVGSIAIASAYASYDVIAKQYEKVKGVTAMQSSSRSIMRMIERDIRMAGFKWRNSKGTITFGSISEPIKITDSGNKCCDAVTVTYDYRDEASKKVERHKIHYTVSPYQGRNRLYRKRDILFPKARAGNNDVLADYVEDLQIGGPDGDSSSYIKLDKSGNELPDSAMQWACIKDNQTGLIWEVKLNANGIPHRGSDRFRWGGKGALQPGTSFCVMLGNKRNQKKFCDKAPPMWDGSRYHNDWNVLVDVSNNEQYCGISNWMVPSQSQLLSLGKLEGSSYKLNLKYFPESRSHVFWAIEPYPCTDKRYNPNCTESQAVAVDSPIDGTRSWASFNRGRKDRHNVMLVATTSESPGFIVSIDLILRTKKEFGSAQPYKKKDYYEGNYDINKNDAYKRQEYSSTVVMRNPS